MFTTLLSPAELHSRLKSCVVVDCRFDLANPSAGEAAYHGGHIPGAVYAHLDRDLSGPKSAQTGRHPLPDPNSLARTLGRWGIDASTQVIAYDADNGMFAARLWWLLRWLGHRAVAVLDGGFAAWVKEGLPVSQEAPVRRDATFVPHVDASAVVSTAEVAQLLQRSDWRVLDARASERFRGEVEPIDPVAGHIPGARNHPFTLNLDGGRFLPAAELARRFAASLDGVPSERSIMMCGSGVTACQNLLALEIAGLHGATLYAGSWSEWIREPTRPVERNQ